jgi:hypothetical protein
MTEGNYLRRKNVFLLMSGKVSRDDIRIFLSDRFIGVNLSRTS